MRQLSKPICTWLLYRQPSNFINEIFQRQTGLILSFSVEKNFTRIWVAVYLQNKWISLWKTSLLLINSTFSLIFRVFSNLKLKIFTCILRCSISIEHANIFNKTQFQLIILTFLFILTLILTYSISHLMLNKWKCKFRKHLNISIQILNTTARIVNVEWIYRDSIKTTFTKRLIIHTKLYDGIAGLNFNYCAPTPEYNRISEYHVEGWARCPSKMNRPHHVHCLSSSFGSQICLK